MLSSCRSMLGARRSSAVCQTRAVYRCYAMTSIPPVHGTEAAAKQHIKVGTKLPSDVKFGVFKSGSDKPSMVDITNVLGGKKAVIFGTPGAFSSVCSKHLPEYNAKASELKSKGVDVIACVSVNDAFAMRDWAQRLNIDPENVVMLADGDANFVKSIGLSQELPGMGVRAMRFSAYVDNMEVKHINIEEAGDSAYRVSGPDHMMKEDLSKMSA